MTDVKKEISGFFLSAAKFAAHVDALASPDCTTSHLRLFHNEPHHTASVVQALTSNTSVTNFDVFEMDAVAAKALAALLSSSPRLTSLAVHHLQDAVAVAHVAAGLASNTSLTHLTLSQLDANGVTAIANAIATWSDCGTASAATPSPPVTDIPLAARPHRLQHLHLDKCRFTADAARALAEALGGQAGALVRLEVVECELGEAAAEALLSAPGWAALKRAPALTAIDMSSCHIGAKGAALLGDFLAASGSLQALCLANNKALGCAGMEALRPGLAANRSLRRLDLSACRLGPAGATALAAALAGRRPSAATSDPAAAAVAAASSRAGGGPAADRPPQPQPPAEAEGSQPTQLAPESAAADGRCPLQHLILSDNAVGAAGMLALMRAMSEPCPCGLRALQLERNHIRGVELAEALGLPTQTADRAAQPPAVEPTSPPSPLLLTAPLEQLGLAGNALYDTGVAALAVCLAEAPALEELDLRENGISDGGVVALLPLAVRGASGRGCFPPLQGLLLDGNRLHNVGGQVLLEAVTAAPGLWRFSAEANKLTDPALRLSLAQLSQIRAARHSQLVVLGRHYSSSSSDDDDAARRNSGGGGATSGRGARSRGGNEGGRGSGGGAAPMDLDGPGAVREQAQQQQQQQQRSSAGGATSTAGGTAVVQYHLREQHQRQQEHQPLKHRREDRSEGGASSCGGSSGGDDDRRPQRNVAARSSIDLFPNGSSTTLRESNGTFAAAWSGPAAGGGGSVDDNSICFGGGCSGGAAVATARVCGLSEAFLCMPSGAAGRTEGDRGTWLAARSSAGGSSLDETCSDNSLCGLHHMSSAAPRGGAGGGAASSAAAGMLCTSPPAGVCFVTATTGVGGAASVPVSKRDGMEGVVQPGAGEEHQHQHPAATPKALQQILPACRRPRYKPLTAEQQRLFEDF